MWRAAWGLVVGAGALTLTGCGQEAPAQNAPAPPAGPARFAKGTTRIELRVSPLPGSTVDAARIEQACEILRDRFRAAAFPVAEARPLGTNRIELVFSQAERASVLLEWLLAVGKVEFRWLPTVRSPRNRNRPIRLTNDTGEIDAGPAYLFEDADGDEVSEARVLRDSKLLFTPQDFVGTCEKVHDDASYSADITFQLRPEAARKFADFTTKHTGDLVAVVVDGKIVAMPRFNAPVTDGRGTFRVQLNFPGESYALGALFDSRPLPVKVTYEPEPVGRRVEYSAPPARERE